MDLKWIWDVNIVAAYAAVMSTAVFVWDVIKWWRGGARFRVTATPNMILVGGGVEDPRTFVVVNVYNIGSMTTTVTHVVIFAYKTRVHRWLRRRPLHSAIVNHSSEVQRIPYELKTGHQFMSKCDQTGQIVGWSQHYALYMGVCHTLSKRDLAAYVRPIKTTN